MNAAVGESDEEVILYVPSCRESPKASVIAWHHRRFRVMAKEVHQVVVPSMSVASLLEAYLEAYQIKHVHILQIDTEGMDYDVLNWFFDADVQPAVINFEHLIWIDVNHRHRVNCCGRMATGGLRHPRTRSP